jgi:transcriptional regulator CtsR
MSSEALYDKILDLVKNRIENSFEKIVEVNCEDIVNTLNIAPSTCYQYLKPICKSIGGVYRGGVCIKVKAA